MSEVRMTPQMADALLVYMGRRRLDCFARYVKPQTVMTDFHRTYYAVLDKFAKGEVKRMIVSCPPQSGKALCIDTPVLTTKGWKAHGDLRVGDEVFGEDGRPKRVLWNSGSYLWHTQRVGFADGFGMVAAREHEWEIYADHDDRKGRVRERVETQSIFGRRRHRRSPYIMANAVLEIPHRELPIDPYLLGIWLGDGNSYDKWISCGREDIEYYRPLAVAIKGDHACYKVHLRGLETSVLRSIGVLRNKHIPTEYLLASAEQRKALLRGLMDTDGCASLRGLCEFTQKKGRLAYDVYILMRSLGYKPIKREYPMKIYGREVGTKVRLFLCADKGDKIFGLPRKQRLIDEKTHGDRGDKYKFFIKSVADDKDGFVNCIQVEGGMYLAGYELVPTHNSEGASRILPAFILGLNPDRKIGICSYSANLASTFNRDVQRIMASDEYAELFPLTQIAKSKSVEGKCDYACNSTVTEVVGRCGGLRAVGRGGSLTGLPLDVAILDDLYKDHSEANSPLVRDLAWNWYTTVLRSRLSNGGQELVVFTRWHKDDIIGRIRESERCVVITDIGQLDGLPPDAWAVLNFPAIKEDKPTPIDPREPGEVLWPERHGKAEMERERLLDPVNFACLYQGNPSDAAAMLYHPFKTYTDKGEWGVFVRRGNYTDPADSGKDKTCSICYDVYRSAHGRFNARTRKMEPFYYALVTDMIYTEKGTEVTRTLIPEMLNRNNTQRAWIEGNNGGEQFRKDIMRKTRCELRGFHQKLNKESKILTYAPYVNEQIVFPAGWEERWESAYRHLRDFLSDFRANRHDDIEDVLSEIYLRELAGTEKSKGIRRIN